MKKKFRFLLLSMLCLSCNELRADHQLFDQLMATSGIEQATLSETLLSKIEELRILMDGIDLEIGKKVFEKDSKGRIVAYMDAPDPDNALMAAALALLNPLDTIHLVLSPRPVDFAVKIGTANTDYDSQPSLPEKMSAQLGYARNPDTGEVIYPQTYEEAVARNLDTVNIDDSKIVFETNLRRICDILSQSGIDVERQFRFYSDFDRSIKLITPGLHHHKHSAADFLFALPPEKTAEVLVEQSSIPENYSEERRTYLRHMVQQSSQKFFMPSLHSLDELNGICADRKPLSFALGGPLTELDAMMEKLSADPEFIKDNIEVYGMLGAQSVDTGQAGANLFKQQFNVMIDHYSADRLLTGGAPVLLSGTKAFYVIGTEIMKSWKDHPTPYHPTLAQKIEWFGEDVGRFIKAYDGTGGTAIFDVGAAIALKFPEAFDFQVGYWDSGITGLTKPVVGQKEEESSNVRIASGNYNTPVSLEHFQMYERILNQLPQLTKINNILNILRQEGVIPVPAL